MYIPFALADKKLIDPLSAPADNTTPIICPSCKEEAQIQTRDESQSLFLHESATNQCQKRSLLLASMFLIKKHKKIFLPETTMEFPRNHTPSWILSKEDTLAIDSVEYIREGEIQGEHLLLRSGNSIVLLAFRLFEHEPLALFHTSLKNHVTIDIARSPFPTLMELEELLFSFSPFKKWTSAVKYTQLYSFLLSFASQQKGNNHGPLSCPLVPERVLEKTTPSYEKHCHECPFFLGTDTENSDDPIVYCAHNLHVQTVDELVVSYQETMIPPS